MIPYEIKRILCLISLLVSAQVTLNAEQVKIALIKSRDILPYTQASDGFFEEIHKKNVTIVSKGYILKEGKANSFISDLKEFDPDIILCFGTEAAKEISVYFTDTPIVFSLVSNPVKEGLIISLGKRKQEITGVTIDIPYDLQFNIIKEALPSLKNIGIIYDPGKSGDIVSQAKEDAVRTGMHIAEFPIYDLKEISVVLEDIESKVDVIWSIPDPTIYGNPTTSRAIMLSTLKKNIPFIGFSKSFAKAGALIGIYCEYGDIGKQTAALVMKVVEGKSASEIPVEHPEYIRIALNLNVAKILGLKIPEKFREKADELF
ncbi:MAG: ABC transporter substrate-binding protein [Elusimicrobiota bacterium]